MPRIRTVHPGLWTDEAFVSDRAVLGKPRQEAGGMSASHEYMIAAIPTEYCGRQYRSRLEARWAAFFDLLDWSHEYEPFDLGSWSPDFLLTGWHGSLLVEVKPITEFSDGIPCKMVGAFAQGGFVVDVSLLLVGVSPGGTPGRGRLQLRRGDRAARSGPQRQGRRLTGGAG